MKAKKKLKIINVVGARPNFVKIAPLCQEFKKHPQVKAILVYTGQHYDYKMAKIFFEELNIPKPDYSLEVGSASHNSQTARIMERLEPVILKEKPDLVIVVGDVNSTLAAALAAAKLAVKVAHIEAGLRSFDKSMPEELNRLLTDHVSDYLFITEEAASYNLVREGLAKEKIFFVGNIMIDTLIANLNRIDKVGRPFTEDYCLITLHRPANVDTKKELKKWLRLFRNMSKKIKIVFPVHPRTKKMIDRFRLNNYLKRSSLNPVSSRNFSILSEARQDDEAVYETNIRRGGLPKLQPKLRNCSRIKGLEMTSKGIETLEPLGYWQFLNLVKHAKLVLTDSGGIQEETTYLGIPCLTLRAQTERPVTVKVGTNFVVGTDIQKIGLLVDDILTKKRIAKAKIPPYWDGKTAQRIVKILLGTKK